MEKIGDLVKRYMDLRDEISRENLANVAIEYVSTERAIEDLEAEIKYIKERLEFPYRNAEKEITDVFVRIVKEKDIRESKEQIEQLDETIADLENRLQQEEDGMTELDYIEVSIKEEAQRLDVASVETITDQEISDNSKNFVKNREDMELLNKMREEQQETIEDLRNRLLVMNQEKSYYEIDIRKAQDVIDQIDQRQATDYEDLEAKEADQNKLAEKIALLEQNRTKLEELSRDKVKEAEETLETLNNYTTQENPQPTKPTVEQTIEPPVSEEAIRKGVIPGDRKVKGVRKILQGAGEFIKYAAKSVKNALLKIRSIDQTNIMDIFPTKPEETPEPYDAEHLSPLYNTGYDPDKDNGDHIISAREMYGTESFDTNVEEPVEEESQIIK